jgi:Leucine-rich repeat (LRR) protein
MHSHFNPSPTSLRHNYLGAIPTEIGYLHRLVAIHFESNQLEGEVPSEIGSIKTLKQARLYFNDLTGSIPEEVCSLTSDEDLTYLGADCEDGKVTCDCCTKCF